MKKVISFPVLILMLFLLNACSAKIDASKVPDRVKATFSKQYPGISAEWEKEEGKYEAGFKINGHEASATFDGNGTLEESEEEMKVVELPQSVQDYLKEHYKDKSIEEAAKITLADGSINYEAEINDRDLVFDAPGKFLKEVKD